ncbi:GNAT family N-acetyltransferase [Paenibacillus sp. 7523-1]|uniref:GNAT family N-acetyltransferase n=1 Tax=Paenibacillus sp. 7523-1 TaxID=2022550 RepID=UPI000BA60EA3|nr:GNAT family N-acetyltransferase [Paenibacillus sp. 7523-1]PAD32198.1 GNAT family N-acetyltransferase [Paenibacillus sp. 7523-1]
MFIDPFDQVFEIMKQSFPESEYREYAHQKRLLANPRYHLFTEKNDQNEVIGFLAGWEFEKFRYIENVAVSPAIRGGGIGRRMMERFIKKSDIPVVLEVELPEDDLKRRRIGFYKRLGFQLEDYPYVQPALREGQRALPLQIMSYPAPLTSSEFETVRNVLYKEVYGASDSYVYTLNR